MLQQIPPRPPGHGPHRELFPRRTGPAFDALTPAIVAADLTVSQMLVPSRAARLVEQAMLDPILPDLEEVLEALVEGVFDRPAESAYAQAVRRAVQRVVVERLMGLGEGAPMAEVRAHATEALERIRSRLPTLGDDTHNRLLRREIERFLERPGGPIPSPAAPMPAAPPGSPIGTPALEWLRGAPQDCSWEWRSGF